MEQNMSTPQCTPQQREPLPIYGSQQPTTYAQTSQNTTVTPPDLASCVDSAFGKSLAATIMAWFPICSILSIIFGSMGLKLVKKAEQMAAYYGVSAGGKKIAAKILGKIGKISGIVMTAFYGFYFILLIAIIGSSI